jgi:hypothetical protein
VRSCEIIGNFDFFRLQVIEKMRSKKGKINNFTASDQWREKLPGDKTESEASWLPLKKQRLAWRAGCTHPIADWRLLIAD